MEEELDINEEEMAADLYESRLNDLREKKKWDRGEEGKGGRNDDSNSPGVLSRGRKVVSAISFFRKISEHWLILLAAVLFDILGLIPFVNIVFNAIFGVILFLYFGPRRKKGESELMKIALPIGLGSAIDAFLDILPVNIAAALIRIIFS